MKVVSKINNDSIRATLYFDERSHVATEPFLLIGKSKLPNSIRYHVVRYAKRPTRKAIISLFDSDGIISPRPYELGQCCDGSIDSCVIALFLNFCNKMKLSADDLYLKAYNESLSAVSFDIIEQAKWEGVTYPENWSIQEYEGLIESLTEINAHSLVEILDNTDFELQKTKEEE